MRKYSLQDITYSTTNKLLNIVALNGNNERLISNPKI